MTDLSTLSASAAMVMLSAGELSSHELLDALADRIDRLDPGVNAVVATDYERAHEQAAEADAARQRGESWGPLHGLPMTIKDSYETAGLVTTAGAPKLAHHVPVRDADAVAALKSAGAIVFGKTNLPLYASDFQSYNQVYGRTNNPWNPERIAGGSSGGAAAALAGGMTLLELGSDIGGSIRNPSHYNGVFGHKTSHGLVSLRGHIPGPPGALAPSDLSVAGPMGRSAADLRLGLEVLVAGAPQVPGLTLRPAAPVDPRRLRFAVWTDHPSCLTSAACRAGVERVAGALVDAGAIRLDVAAPVPLDQHHELYTTLLNAVMGPSFPPAALERMRAIAADETASSRERARARGAVLSHGDWLAADEQRWRLIAGYEAMFSDVDVLVAPIAPTPAYPHDTERPFDARIVDVDGQPMPYADQLAWAGLATLPLLPATAIPTGLSPDGLPVGAQIIGPRFADLTTIAVAELIESLIGGFAPPPGA